MTELVIIFSLLIALLIFSYKYGKKDTEKDTLEDVLDDIITAKEVRSKLSDPSYTEWLRNQRNK